MSLSKESKAYINETKIWLKGQQISIESCEQKLRHLSEEVALAKRAMANERKELARKKKTYDTVNKTLKKVISHGK
jgi:hypothetical protein